MEHRSTHNTVQSQKAVSVYFTRKQILPFGFAEQCNNGRVQIDKQNDVFFFQFSSYIIVSATQNQFCNIYFFHVYVFSGLR